MGFKKGAGTKPGKMVTMKIVVPEAVRDTMHEIWETQGYTISQQARLSLMLWAKAHHKDPSKIDSLFAMAVSPRSVEAAVEAALSPAQREQREVQRAHNRAAKAKVRDAEPSTVPMRYRSAGHDPDYDPASDPEPVLHYGEDGLCDSPHDVKVAWFAWRARQGDHAMMRVARGEWPEPKPTPSTNLDWLKDVQYQPKPKPED